MTAPERDINDLLDEIVFTEERILQQGYNEGLAAGQDNVDAYKLGYAQGIQYGQELGEIYGSLIAWQQNPRHSEKVKRKIATLLEAIRKFPQTNAEDEDIIGQHKTILALHKSVRNMMGHRPSKVETNPQATEEQREDFSF